MKKSIKKKTGPKPELLKLTGDWQEAVKKSLHKKKSETVWRKFTRVKE
jgi:hypothetical protein